MNFDSQQLARAIGPSVPNRVLRKLLEEVQDVYIKDVVPNAIVEIFEEVGTRLEEITQNSILEGDLGDMPPGYVLHEFEQDGERLYEARCNEVAYGVPSECSQDAVDSAWKNYLGSMS